MPTEKWTKREVMAHFRVKSWATVWNWQRLRGFPIGTQLGTSTQVLFDVAAVLAWEKQQSRPQFVKDISTGKRPKFNFPQKERADAAG